MDLCICCDFCVAVGEGNLGGGKNGILTADAEAPGPANDASVSTLVLAEKRTKRPDILRNFRQYQGGWDIANKHYWAVSPVPFSM